MNVRPAGYLLIAAMISAVGCRAEPIAPELAASSPLFAADRFFTGRTRGDGSIKIMLQGAEILRVEGNGWIDPDGTLVLDQVVRRGTRLPEKRQWRFRGAGSGRYSGTLSDAAGPVTGEVRGNMLHLNYAMKGKVQAEQWIYLQADGRSALNRMAIRKFGMTVARVDETIRKLD